MLKNSNLVLLGLILIPLSLVSMFYWDQSIALFLDYIIADSLDYMANQITWLGLADHYFWISAIGFLTAMIAEKRYHHKVNSVLAKKYRALFKLMFNSFLVSGFITVLLKFVIGRCRPYHSPVFDPLYFRPLSFNWDFQSYPSGHSQVSFTLASFLAYLFPKFTAIFFAIATVIALTRVILDYHFLGDVIFGAYIGILGFQLALRRVKS